MIAAASEIGREKADGTSIISKLLLHLPLLFLFVCTTVVQCVFAQNAPQKSDNSSLEIALFLCLIPMIPFVFWGRTMGVWKPGILLVDVILCGITLSGMPGSQLNSNISLFVATGFFISLALRNYILFVGLPRMSLALRVHFENYILGWIVAAAVPVLLISLWQSVVLGFQIGGAVRLHSDTWLHPNLIAVYAAMTVYYAVAMRSVRTLPRLALGALGLYVLLLTQSRASLLALVVMLFAQWFLVNYRRGLRFCFWILFSVLLLLVVTPMALPTIVQIPAVDSMLRRANSTSATQNTVISRQIRISESIDSLTKTPLTLLFGFGYKAEDTYLENGLMSLTNETGILGLTLYLTFCFIILFRAGSLLRSRDDYRSQFIGRTVICVTIFIFVRSLGERSHGFQVTEVVSNAWILLSGYLIAYSNTALEEENDSDAEDQGESDAENQARSPQRNRRAAVRGAI